MLRRALDADEFVNRTLTLHAAQHAAFKAGAIGSVTGLLRIQVPKATSKLAGLTPSDTKSDKAKRRVWVPIPANLKGSDALPNPTCGFQVFGRRWRTDEDETGNAYVLVFVFRPRKVPVHEPR